MVHVCIVSSLSVFRPALRFAEINSTCQLPEDYEINIVYYFLFYGRFINKRRESGNRSYIGIKAQFFTHCQQSLFRSYFCFRVIVVFGVTDSTEKYGIGIFTKFKGLFRKRVTDFINGCCSYYSLFK